MSVIKHTYMYRFLRFLLVGRNNRPRFRRACRFRSVFSVPETLHSDQGFSFEIEFVKTVAIRLWALNKAHVHVPPSKQLR